MTPITRMRVGLFFLGFVVALPAATDERWVTAGVSAAMMAWSVLFLLWETSREPRNG